MESRSFWVNHALARPIRSGRPVIPKKEREYDIKGVIHGLQESNEILNERASEIGAKYMKRLGKPGSKAVLVAYDKDIILPESINIDGCRYKMQEHILWPLRCNQCHASVITTKIAAIASNAVHVVRTTPVISV